MEDTIGIVVLYGMGGVGKTTLLTQINNKFLVTPNHFDFVIWAVVSKDLQLEKIQESITKKIGLFNESWSSKNVQEKAQEIFKILRNKKFELLLDDMWEPVDLAQMGLPIPSPRSTSSKVVFTSREFEVCGQMEAHRSFKVECLGYEDASKLFEKKVGREILDSHPDIPELAEIVAKECGGLPLALITVGRAMASKKTPQEWEHAIEVLRSSSSKFLGMERWVYSRLKFSYDFLPTDTIRFCVFYCCLFPEDSKISIEDLIDCWMCEGILDEYDGFGARNQGAGLTGAPRIGMWKEITRMSLMQNAIQNLTETPTCPHLRALFLHSNHLGEVKRIQETRGFHSLQKVYINYSKFRHATWLVLPPRVKVIRISNCQRLQEIISMEKLGEISAEVMDNLILFGRLEYLILEGLQNLKSIHSSYLPFPRLKEICVWKCAELKKLPLDCNQGLEQKIIIKGQDRWWNELQWDDQATQNASLPCFQSLY